MNAKLYVGNLSFSTTAEELRAAFEPFGQVDDIHIATDRETGQPRGFAFVTYANADDAKVAAEKLSGFELNGRMLTVNEAKAKEAIGGVSAGGKVFSSPNRRPGAFYARGNRRR